MPLTEDEVIWGYRMFLGRYPESDATIKLHAQNQPSLDSFRKFLVETLEFRSLLRVPKEYDIPHFLIPDSENGRIVIEEPTLLSPTSQLCTYEQTTEVFYQKFCKIAGFDPKVLNRKTWEWAYIYRVFDQLQFLRKGKKGLVFAVGREPLPAMFAAKGCEILATDGPNEVGSVWSENLEYSNSVRNLWQPKIVDLKIFERNVAFREVNMLNIPDDLRNFDFVWSSCAFEHLGSIKSGGDFVINAMACLKPGGIAVHTTEFNLSSNDATIDGSPTCLFRRRDIERLKSDLEAAGHSVSPINFWPGRGKLDSHIDYPPYAPPHLKLALYQFVATSIGLIITKDGARQARTI